MSENTGPIQVIPAGLLGLLDLKNRGIVPDVLMGTVQPIVDMEGFWLRARREPVDLGNGWVWPGGLHLEVLTTTPQNEWWYVHDWKIDVNSTDTILGAQFFGLADSNGRAFFLSPGTICQFPANAATALYVQWIGGLWIPPGSQVSVLGDIDGNDPVVSSAPAMHITRCRV